MKLKKHDATNAMITKSRNLWLHTDYICAYKPMYEVGTAVNLHGQFLGYNPQTGPWLSPTEVVFHETDQ